MFRINSNTSKPGNIALYNIDVPGQGSVQYVANYQDDDFTRVGFAGPRGEGRYTVVYTVYMMIDMIV